jgi:hypothetical protein
LGYAPSEREVFEVTNRIASSAVISTAVGAAFAVGISLWAQAPPAAPNPSLTPSQAVAPAGGSNNPDATKAAAKGGGRGRGRGPAVPAGPAPRLPDGHVDLVGIYGAPNGPVGDIASGMPIVPCDSPDAVKQAAANGRAPGTPVCREAIPLSAEGKRVLATHMSKDDPEANCLPTGVPRQSPYPWRIVQDKNHFFFLFEGNIHSYRQIFMDGRKHPDDPDPTWYGNSIGSWDGDTLVVDTIGYNDKFWFDFAGHPHSEKLHTIERYTRTDAATLSIATTIDDPVDYTKPFTITFTARAQPNGELTEYICQENQQDAQHLQGPASLN